MNFIRPFHTLLINVRIRKCSTMHSYFIYAVFVPFNHSGFLFLTLNYSVVKSTKPCVLVLLISSLS